MPPTPFICSFCSSYATYSPIQQITKHNAFVFFCFNCQTEFILLNNLSILTYSIYSYLNLNLYRWSVYNNIHSLWLINSTNIPGSIPNSNLTLLHSWKSNPPIITPSNFSILLPSLLLFL